MNSKDYWAERGKELIDMVDNRSKLTFDEVNKLYAAALASIAARIQKIYAAFAKGYHITPEQAQTLLTVAQTREARAALLALYDAETDWTRREILRAKLDAPAYRWRISKLEALRDQVYFDCQAITTPEIQYGEARLKDVYTEAYYREVYAQSAETGTLAPFSTMTDRRAEEAVKAYWSGDESALGRQFSERVWGNTTEMAKEVRTIVTEELLTGGNYPEMMRRLDDAVGHAEYRKRVSADGTTEKVLTGTGASYRSARLIRTECNYIAGQATLESLRESGIERYIYWALLERRTCKVCGALDGKDFLVAKQQVGVNMHPMHPNCRCFIGPYRPKEEMLGTRSTEFGFVPRSMTYQEWRAKYVDGEETLQNAAGQAIIKARKTTQKGRPNSITQVETKKGGINRNYYDNDGNWSKQVTNNNHGNAKKHPYGNHGEHVHDIIWKDGKVVGRPARELTVQERKENEDIL